MKVCMYVCCELGITDGASNIFVVIVKLRSDPFRKINLMLFPSSYKSGLFVVHVYTHVLITMWWFMLEKLRMRGSCSKLFTNSLKLTGNNFDIRYKS